MNNNKGVAKIQLLKEEMERQHPLKSQSHRGRGVVWGQYTSVFRREALSWILGVTCILCIYSTINLHYYKLYI